MSLQPELEYTVPEQTARIARAAFPKSTLCMKIYDHLGTIFRDHDFADIFPQRGQPAQSPFRLALITILQFIEGLSDRAAADAVRGRIDWKYLLCLEIDDGGFDFSVLSEFRARLIDNGMEQRLLDNLLAMLREKKLVKARGRQRTDSTHILAAIRNLNRLERVGETLRAALNTLATIVPEWVRDNVPTEWVERYGHRIEAYRLPESELQRAVSHQRIQKAHKLLPQMVATITFFFQMVINYVQQQSLPVKIEELLYQQLIPGFYLQLAASKAKSAEQRNNILTTAQSLLAAATAPGAALNRLEKDQLVHIENLAKECAQLFQRSSSCVEGRNGQLSLRHHSLHRLTNRKLQVLTTVHNYFIKRDDGSTAAQRFFGAPSQDLFKWLLDRMDLPARPAMKRSLLRSAC